MLGIEATENGLLDCSIKRQDVMPLAHVGSPNASSPAASHGVSGSIWVIGSPILGSFEAATASVGCVLIDVAWLFATFSSSCVLTIASLDGRRVGGSFISLWLCYFATDEYLVGPDDGDFESLFGASKLAAGCYCRQNSAWPLRV